MSIVVRTLTITCNHPGCKHAVEVTGPKVNTNNLYAAARKEGWLWRGMTEQLCAEHREQPAKKAKPAAKKAKGKKAAKKADKPTRKVAKLPGVDALSE